jgi:type III secretory pathway lipoprotein EscJ
MARLVEVANEQEASMICGYLESHGIHATYDSRNSQGVGGGADWFGRQEILVPDKDLARARELLEKAEKR